MELHNECDVSIVLPTVTSDGDGRQGRGAGDDRGKKDREREGRWNIEGVKVKLIRLHHKVEL